MNYFYKYIADTSISPDEYNRLLLEMPAERAAKISRMTHATDRNNAIMAIIALKELLSCHMGITHLPAIAYNAYGKPYFPEQPDIYFNYSHSGCEVLCAISPFQIGTDIQCYRPISSAVLERKYSREERNYILASTNPEQTAVLLWAYKESYLKAIGCGLSRPLDTAYPNISALPSSGPKIGQTMEIVADNGRFYGKLLSDSAMGIYVIK